MMLRQLERFFAYDHWANREVLKVLRDANPVPPRARSFLAHVMAAQQLWYDRLEQQPQTMAVWPDLTLEECTGHAERLAEIWRAYLAGLTAERLAASVPYTNTKGERWSNTVLDILLHVILHSAYHRGQIATDTRAAGHTPAYTDYIQAVRQESV